MIDSLHVKLILLLYDKIFFKYCKVKKTDDGWEMYITWTDMIVEYI